MIFVLACDGTIVPLVFQSKYSADSSTAELENTTLSYDYKTAKIIMKHAGWEPEEFIFVVHMYYRVISDSVLGAPPTPTIATRPTDTRLRVRQVFA